MKETDLTDGGQERRLHHRLIKRSPVVVARVCLVAVEWWLSTTKTTLRFWMAPWDKGYKDGSLRQNEPASLNSAKKEGVTNNQAYLGFVGSR